MAANESVPVQLAVAILELPPNPITWKQSDGEYLRRLARVILAQDRDETQPKLFRPEGPRGSLIEPQGLSAGQLSERAAHGRGKEV